MNWSKLILLLQISISAFSIFFILYILDLMLIVESLKLLSIWHSSFSVLLTLLSLYLISVRWTYITEQTDKNKYPLAKSAYLYSNIYNLITPGNIGGDVYKFFYFKEKDSADILKKIILERLYGVFSLIILASISFLINKENVKVSLQVNSENFLMISSLFIILCLVIYLLFKNIKILRDVLTELRFLIKEKYISQIYILFYSFFNLIIWSFSIYILNLSFGIDATYNEILFVCLAVELIRFIPISFQGIGVREASFVFFMTGYGYQAESAFSLGFIAYAILTICLLFSGILGFFKIQTNHD